MTKRIFLFVVALGVCAVGSVSGDDNVRAVQTKLRESGFYSGQIDGAYSGALSAALSRYQTSNGLPITGQLDIDTSKALGAKPAVTSDPAQSAETWRRLRQSERQSVAKSDDDTATSDEPNQKRPSKASVANRSTIPSAAAEPENKALPETERVQSPAPISKRVARVASATQTETQPVPETARVERVDSPAPAAMPAARVSSESHSPSLPNLSKARLRDYVAAYVLAGLDPATEIEFFADQVTYYDGGVKDRATIQKDLKRYSAQWPNRKFWVAGEIKIDKESNQRLRVTFPLSFDLRNGEKRSTGKVEKSLILEATGGDDLQIVAVDERGIE
jgi:peptidoglycan hydrolase-like protein with peptidoglycan-binding domain